LARKREESWRFKYKPHFVKVWTKGDPYSEEWKCYGATDDGKVYLINFKDLRRSDKVEMSKLR